MIANGVKIEFKKNSKDAIVPTYEKDGDAGCSLRSIEDYKIGSGERVLVRTGIKAAIPYGFEGQVRSRSGQALKKGIAVLNSPGTIDSGYRGELMVILINTGKDPVTIKKGDAIAQLVIAPVYVGHFIEVNELDSSDRGVGGLGSTGR